MSTKKRAPIPEPLRQLLYKETGFKCAIKSCNVSELDIHHIIKWSIVKEHTYENLIALCPTHHRMADREKITPKALRLIKAELQTAYGLPVTSTRKGKLWSTCTIYESSIPNSEIIIELPQIHSQSSRYLKEVNVVLHADSIMRLHNIRKETFEDDIDYILTDDEREKLLNQRNHLPEEKDFYLQTHNTWMYNKEILSVKYLWYSDVSHAAHPNRSTTGFNYYLDPPMPISLSNLFKVDVNWRKFICESTNSLVREFVGNDDVYETTEKLVATNIPQERGEEALSSFSLSENYLHLSFDPYCLASYAFGGIEVCIPYKELIPFVHESSPIYKLCTNSKRKRKKLKIEHY